MDFINRSRFSAKALFDFSTLTPQIKGHLLNVYQLLSVCIAVFSTAIFITIRDLVTINAMAAHFISLMLVVYLASSFITHNSNQSQFWRIAALLSFSFLQGTQVSGLVRLALEIDPSIVLMAASTTAAIFVSFSLAALLSSRRSFLFLGGVLFSSLNFMALLSLFAWLFPALRNLQLAVSLYGGLLIFSGYVIFDTQMMVERAAVNGKDADAVRDALELFMDIVSIFVRILVHLIKESTKESRKK